MKTTRIRTWKYSMGQNSWMCKLTHGNKRLISRISQMESSLDPGTRVETSMFLTTILWGLWHISMIQIRQLLLITEWLTKNSKEMLTSTMVACMAKPLKTQWILDQVLTCLLSLHTKDALTVIKLQLNQLLLTIRPLMKLSLKKMTST